MKTQIQFYQEVAERICHFHWTQLFRIGTLCLALLLVALLRTPFANAETAAARNFTLRYDVLAQGANITQIGNLLKSCQSGTNSNVLNNSCTNVRAGTVADWNDYFGIIQRDFDNMSGTVNSSSATLDMALIDPDGAGPLTPSFTIARAQLYWGGVFNPNTASGQTDANKMKFRRDGDAAYVDITADQFDSIDITNGGVGRVFGGTADVTNLFTANGWGNGVYWGANVQGTLGCTVGSQSCSSGAMGNYAGWALIVVYVDHNDTTTRYIGINDGFQCVYNVAGRGCPNPLDTQFTGFNIPALSEQPRWGLLAWDGDSAGVGDTFTLNGVQQSDAAHLANNYFRSRISKNGAIVGGRNPNYTDTLGMDLIESNGGTFADPNTVTASFSTNGDIVTAHFFWLVTESTATDFGDAPASYGSASHNISLSATKLRMGAKTTDPEVGMQNTGDDAITALGDDTHGTDDEDGVTLPSFPGTATSYSVTVAVQNDFSPNNSTPVDTANLYAWLDFNNDGIFNNNEIATATIAPGETKNVELTWSGFAPRPSGTKMYLRFRLTTNVLTASGSDDAQDQRSIGFTSNGEVEDHRVDSYTPTSATLISFTAKPNAKGVVSKWETGTESQVIGFNVWRSQKRSGAYEKVNKKLLAAKNIGQLSGAAYRFQDKKVEAGKTYFYKIEIVTATQAPEWSDLRRVRVP